MNFKQRKKEEFYKRFTHTTVDQNIGSTSPAIFIKTELLNNPDAVWSFFSQSLSDYKKELVEELMNKISKLPVKNGYLFGDDIFEMLSLLQKDKENK